MGEVLITSCKWMIWWLSISKVGCQWDKEAPLSIKKKAEILMRAILKLKLNQWWKHKMPVFQRMVIIHPSQDSRVDLSLLLRIISLNKSTMCYSQSYCSKIHSQRERVEVEYSLTELEMANLAIHRPQVRMIRTWQST